MVMVASSIHQKLCTPVSERHVRCFVLFPLLFVCLFRSPALSRQSGGANSPSSSTSSPASSDLPCSFSSSNSIQICFMNLFKLTDFCFSISTQCHRSHKLVESGLAAHSPCQLKTGPVSSKQIHTSTVHTPWLTSNSITVPSRVFRTCGFFSSSTTIFPARMTFCSDVRGVTTLALLNVLHL